MFLKGERERICIKYYNNKRRRKTEIAYTRERKSVCVYIIITRGEERQKWHTRTRERKSVCVHIIITRGEERQR